MTDSPRVILERWQRARALRHTYEPSNSPSGPLRELVHAAGEAIDDDRDAEAKVLLDAFDLLVARLMSQARTLVVKPAPLTPKEMAVWDRRRAVEDALQLLGRSLRGSP